MNDGVFVTRKTFGSVEDTLSAFYQLWMLPDMQDRGELCWVHGIRYRIRRPCIRLCQKRHLGEGVLRFLPSRTR